MRSKFVYLFLTLLLIYTWQIPSHGQSDDCPNLTLPGWWAPQINEVRFSPDAKTLVSVSENGLINIWSLSQGRLVRSIKLPPDEQYTTAFSKDGKTLATASWSEVSLRDARTGVRKQIWNGLDGRVIALAFNLNGDILAATSEDARQGDSTSILRLLNLSKGQTNLTSRLAEPTSAAISQSGKYLAVSLGNGTLKVWDIPGSKLRWQHPYNISSLTGPVTFSPDNSIIAIGVMEIHYEDAGELAKSMVIDKNYIQLLKSSDGTIQRNIPYQLSPSSFMTSPIAFSPNRKSLAIGNQLHYINNGKLLRSIPQEKITTDMFSPNGRLLALGSGNGKIRLWDTANGKLVATLIAGAEESDWLIFTPGCYFIGSESLIRRIQWQTDGQSSPSELYTNRYNRQDLIREFFRKYF